MISIIFLITIVRISYPTGEINYIPKLESSQIQNFIDENPMSVVFFTNDPDECSFANFAITHFAKYIRFAVSPEKNGQFYHCNSYPCVRFFTSNEKYVSKIRPAPHQLTLFAHWCCELLNRTRIEIKNAEYLRSILNIKNGFFAIGIDEFERPNYLPSEIPFYCCSLEFFQQLNILNVQKGIFFFNAVDHFLNAINEKENFSELIQTRIVEYDDINPGHKKFTAGFYFDSKDQTKSEKEMNLLLNLSKIFGEDFYFTKFDDQALYDCRLQFVKKPIFIVLKNSQSLMSNNWILNGDEALQFEKISDFLTKINKNPINYSHRSGFDKYSIEIDRFNELVFESNENDSILIIADDFSKYIYAKTAVEAVLSHLNSKTIDFFTLNATINELPDMINPKELPALIILRGGKNKKENPPIFFHGDFLFQEIVAFIQQTATSKLQVKPYDIQQKEDLIRKMRNEQKN